MFQNLRRGLREGDTLKVRCGACGHARAFPRREAFAVYGGDAWPDDIRRRSRCGACGAGENCTVWI
jgi:hypothetical protein